MANNLKSIEQSLKKEHQKYIDEFSTFLELSKKSVDADLGEFSNQSLNRIYKGIANSSNMGIDDKDNSMNLQNEIFKLLETLIKLKIHRIDYSDISNVIMEYERKLKGDSISDTLDNFFQLVKKELIEIIRLLDSKSGRFASISDEEVKQYEQAITAFYKSLEHSILANLQFEHLYLETQAMVEKTQQQLEQSEKKIQILKSDIASWEPKIKGFDSAIDDKIKTVNSDIDSKYKELYTDFIAILGVFSSFVFVMFGGFSSLSEIIATLSLKEVSVARTLMISSFLMASMFTIVYSLIVWIAKIIGKSIIVKSCECNICRDPWHMFLRHKLYSIIMTTLVAVFIISLGVTIFVNIGDEFQTINVSRFILLSNLTLIVVWTLLYPFLLWIAKITGKSFKKCYSPKCQGDCLHKYKHLFYRRPVYFCVISILIFFICIPYIYQFIDKYVVEWILN